MNRKREEAQRAAEEARRAAEEAWCKEAEARRAEEAACARAAEAKVRAEEVIPFLRHLGCHADEARRAAAHCEALPADASIEERVSAALSFFGASRGRLWKSRPAVT